jgi:23S rRNA (adenine2030-N6)-methyltransferase
MVAQFYPAPMLSYRHAFHAGNHADVLKHLVLMLCIQHMNSKDKPYTLVDTHAGAGFYALDDEHAKRTGEYLDGIGRLWPRKDLPPALAEYVAVVRALNGSATLRRYPGSPRVAASLIRDTAQVHDHLRLCELHSTDFALLRRQFKDAGRRVTVEQADGFEVLKAALPPPSRRGLVLIDPSYEIKSDYMKVAAALKDGLKRFATGTYLVWHPLLPTIEANHLPDRLKKTGASHWLHATLSVRAPATKGRGMHGSGMFVVNPPWPLQAALQDCLPWLAAALALDEKAGWQVQVSDAVTTKPRAN